MDVTSIASMTSTLKRMIICCQRKCQRNFRKRYPRCSVFWEQQFPQMGYNDRDHFARYITPLDDEIRMQLEGGDNNLDWSTISIISYASLLHTLYHVNEEIEGLLFQDITTRPQANSDTRRIHSSSSTPTNNVQDSNARISRLGGSTIRNPRRQNHSCDQCRSSKKACNLPLRVGISGQKPSTPCATCNARGLECTVAWLASKKSEKQSRKKARTSSYLREDSYPLNSTDLSIVTEEHQRIDDTRSRSGSLSTLEVD